MKAWVVLALCLAAAPVRAQQTHQSFEAGAHVAAAKSAQFETYDFGIGGRFAWRPTEMLGAEAELTIYPGSFPNANGFSSRRVEALFGATAGPRIGAFRPFGRFRPGLVRFDAPERPIVCIAIFPSPLSCALAAGRTLLAVDIGGGVDVAIGGRTFFRVDAGDRMVRFPGPAIDAHFVRRDSSFFSHEFRFAAGGGFRF